MDLVTLTGTLAAICTTIAFMPQAWMVWKTRCTDGISLGMYLIFSTGVALWLAYGLLIEAWPIIIANLITLAMSVFILVMKIRSG